MTLRVRAALLALVVTVFVIVFFLLHGVSAGAGALITIPVVAAAWLFGLRAGVLAGVLAWPLNTLLLNLVEGGGWTVVWDQGGGAGMLAVIFIGGVVGALRDLREQANVELERRKVAERELRQTTARLVQQGRLAALGEMAASVAHELNQPLNATKLISQSLLRYEDPSDEVRQDLEQIVQSVQRMSDIVDHLRVFARPGSVDPQPIDANVVVQRTLSLVGASIEAEGIELSVDESDELPNMLGDAVRLELVLVSVIINARESLEDCERDPKKIQIRTYVDRSAETSIVMEVRDNGIGIPEDDLAHVFEPFFSSKNKAIGTGLGLTIAHDVVEQHGGRITLEREDVGTTVRVILPAP